MKIGAHVSIAKSLDLAIDRAVEIGAECIQIFGSAPQQWQFLVFPGEEIEAFKKKAQKHDVSPVFVHSIYLINLASENPFILDKSLTSLIQYLGFSSLINAEGVVVHVGSHKGRGWKAVKKQVFEAISEILKRTSASAGETLRVNKFKPEGSGNAEGKGQLILENSAGAGGVIGANFGELGEIIRAVKSPRVKVCLDTAHAFESGYNIREQGVLDKTLEEFNREIGLDQLVLIHANDSKTPLGSNADRHENIGEGHISKKGFRVITNHVSLRHLPFVIETPGFDKKGVDKKNLDTLKKLSRPRTA